MIYLYYRSIEILQAACRNEATCTGFVYWASTEDCDLKTGAICEGGTITYDTDATYFMLAGMGLKTIERISVTSRAVLAHCSSSTIARSEFGK